MNSITQNKLKVRRIPIILNKVNRTVSKMVAEEQYSFKASPKRKIQEVVNNKTALTHAHMNEVTVNASQSVKISQSSFKRTQKQHTARYELTGATSTKREDTRVRSNKTNTGCLSSSQCCLSSSHAVYPAVTAKLEGATSTRREDTQARSYRESKVTKSTTTIKT